MDDAALAAVDAAHVQEDVTAVLDTLAALVEQVEPATLIDSARCGDWSVRDLLNHIVFENLAHAALAGGADMPAPDASTDHLGDDHLEAFRHSAALARSSLTDPALLSRTFGPAPGSFVAQMFVNEQLTHAWDLARATGRPTDLAPDAARRALPSAQAFYGAVPRSGVTYLPALPVPRDATPADQLVAYLGRDTGGAGG